MERIFNKLVRDKIPNIIESNNEIAVTRVLNDEEYKIELCKKLLEECNEVIVSETSENIIEELADVLEVLESIAGLENKTLDDIKELASKKKDKRGGFENRIFLESTYSKED